MHTGFVGKIHILNRLGTTLNFVVPPVPQTPLQKLRIQAVHGIDPGNRNQKVIPGIAHQILHQSLLVAAGHITEVGGKHIMG